MLAGQHGGILKRSHIGSHADFKATRTSPGVAVQIEQAESRVWTNHLGMAVGADTRRRPRSESEDLLLLGFKILNGDDPLVPKVSEFLEFLSQ